VRRRIILTLLVTYLTTVADFSPAHAASEWRVWAIDSLTRVQSNDLPGTGTTAVVKTARNEYETFQVIVRAPDTTDLSGVNVTVSDLIGPKTITKSNIALYRAHYVPVTTRSEFPNNGWYSPNPPGNWADALVPSSVPGGIYQSFPFSVLAGKNQPILIEVFVPKESPAGTYTGSITVTATGQSQARIPLILTVWGFTLPDRPSLASQMWSYDEQLSEASRYIVGADRVTLLNTLQGDYRKHRLGVGETGSGPHPSPIVTAILQKQTRIQVSWGLPDAKLQEIVNAYGVHLLYAQHFDEPKDQARVDKINDPNGEVQRYRRNGVPELLTVSWPFIGWMANVDIFVAVPDALIPFANAQAKLDIGKYVWSYQAGIMPHKAPTWLLDYNLIHFRMVPWLDYSTGLSGFLYWTPVNWCPADPWTNPGTRNPSCGYPSNKNMEGVLYFPGDKVGAPNAAIPSARLKAIRDGVEDYDYLALLAALGDPAYAKTLARTLAPAWDSWNYDPVALLAAREQAAARIVQLSGMSTGPKGAIPLLTLP